MDADSVDWEQLYKDNFIPWDTGLPDRHLTRFVKDNAFTPCRALDIGCGTGASAIWLAQQGFDVTGIDVSSTALEMARARPEGKTCTFVLHDFLQQPVPATDFGLVFDMGCFHTFKSTEAREQFAVRVSHCLAKDGHWLSVCGSCDGPDIGPPRLTALEIVSAAEPCFEILSLTASKMERLPKEMLEALELPADTRPRAWSCLMRKRDIAD